MRLRGRGDGTVEVRSPAAKSRGVSNRNGVVATRGGAHRNENDQSVTMSRHTGTRKFDSVGVDGRAFARLAKLVARARGAEPKRRTAGWSPDDSLMVGDGMAGSPWDRNQGDPPVLEGSLGQPSAHLAGGSQSVRSSEEAGHDRGAKGTQESGSAWGRLMEKQTSASACEGCPAMDRTWSQQLGSDRRNARRTRGRGEDPLPLARAPTDWKAGCGRPACSVWS